MTHLLLDEHKTLSLGQIVTAIKKIYNGFQDVVGGNTLSSLASGWSITGWIGMGWD